MRQCCKAMVNNSLIQPRGHAALHPLAFSVPGCRARALHFVHQRRSQPSKAAIAGPRLRADVGSTVKRSSSSMTSKRRPSLAE